MEIPSPSLKIIYVFCAAVYWVIEEGCMHLMEAFCSQASWRGHRDWGNLHLFCLSVWCYCHRALLVLQVLGVFDTAPGERNEVSGSRFCKNCMYAGQPESQCHQDPWSIPCREGSAAGVWLWQKKKPCPWAQRSLILRCCCVSMCLEILLMLF